MAAPSRRTTLAARAHTRAQSQLERARAELRLAVLDDLAAGVQQQDLAAVTGYSRERLRQLARAAELERDHA